MLNPFNIISKFIKSNNQKQLDRIKKIVSKVNDYEEQISKLSEQDLKKITQEIDQAKKAGYDVSVIAKALDAFYSNYDNIQIPLLEALRIVSLAQDSKTEKADLYLLKAQKRYKY